MPDPTTPSTATLPEQMHAYNPVTEPQLFRAVIRKRCVAFLVDAVIIAALTVIAFVFVAVLGVLTLGLGWLLFGMVFPIVALAYNAFTIGGPKSSTIGQRMMGLAVPMWYGGKVTPLIAAFHALLFWFSLTLFFPILLWCFFDSRKRCLHDILAGVLVINRPAAREPVAV
ncbi:MAG: RDD family protein [Methyloceanibacter sp.]|nr:RDD family protein [Methyloceanibacter sp.]